MWFSRFFSCIPIKLIAFSCVVTVFPLFHMCWSRLYKKKPVKNCVILQRKSFSIKSVLSSHIDTLLFVTKERSFLCITIKEATSTCVNVPDDVRLRDENKDRMVNRGLHVGRVDFLRMSLDRNRYFQVAALSDYWHPCRGFAFSTLYDGFGTKFWPFKWLDGEKKCTIEKSGWQPTWVSVRLRLNARFSLSHTDK